MESGVKWNQTFKRLYGSNKTESFNRTQKIEENIWGNVGTKIKGIGLQSL